MSEVTQILTAIEQGDARSTDELLPVVYNELRRLAARKMANEPAGHTLQPTALVHEAWLRLLLRFEQTQPCLVKERGGVERGSRCFQRHFVGRQS